MIKKLALSAVAVATLGVASASHAADAEGAYIFAQPGLSMTHIQSKTIDGVKVNGDKENGFGFRLGAGYDFNQYVAAELGLAKYANAEIDVAGFEEAKVKPFAIDLLVKGTYALSDDFFVYGKTGIAYVNVNYNSSNNFFEDDKSDNKHFLRPELALGAGYNVNENVAVDASYSRIVGTGDVQNTPDYLPNLDLLAVGITYKF